MARRLFTLIGMVLLCFTLMTGSTLAGSTRPLPPLPSPTVINYVLNQTGGAQFVPLGTQQMIMSQLASFNGMLDGVENMVDTSQAVHYITTSGQLRETVIPLRNSRLETLDPAMALPGTDRLGKIIGVLYQPSRGVMVVVASFKPKASDPEKVRFYYTDTNYYEYSMYWGVFHDFNGDRVLEAVDEGSIISHKYTCVAIGLEQMCWVPYNYSALRDSDNPKDIAYRAYTRMKDIYDLDVDFYVDDAVPDLLGRNVRNTCAAQLSTATSFNALSNCVPNVVFTSSKTLVSGQPIAIMVVTRSVDVRAYRADGSYIGVLPIGEYLVMDATPSVTTPGSPALLYLVNADGANHFLIPSVVQQGFGQNAAIDERYAAIRDGLMSWRGVGY